MAEPTNEQLLAELRELQQTQTAFIGQLVHELRNGLAPVQNGLHLLRLKGEDRATREQTLEMLDKQVGLLAKLLENLSKTSRGI